MALSVRVVMSALLALAIVTPAVARTKAPAAARESVQPLIDAATDAMNGQDYAWARRSLQEAYRRSRAADLLYRLAEVERLDGHEVAARDFYRRFVAEGADEAPDNLAAAHKQLAAPVPLGGELAVTSERGALVLLDDQVVGISPLSLPLFVTPGSHKLAVELGKRKQEDRVDALAGRTIEVRFPLNAALVVVTMAPALITRTSFEGLPDGLPQRLADAVAHGVRQRKLGAQSESAALVVAPDLASCLRTTDCQQQLARKNQVAWVLTVTGGVSQATVNGFALTFDLFDAERGDYLVRTTRSCGPCTAEKVIALVAEMTSSVVAEAQSRPRNGAAPPAATSPAPPVIADSGDAPKAAKRGGRPLWRLITGPLAMAAGVALIGAGAAGLSINQRCVTVDENNPDLCQPFQDMSGVSRATIYDTFTPGISLVVSGSVLAAAGIILVAIPGKSAATP